MRPSVKGHTTGPLELSAVPMVASVKQAPVPIKKFLMKWLSLLGLLMSGSDSL